LLKVGIPNEGINNINDVAQHPVMLRNLADGFTKGRYVTASVTGDSPKYLKIVRNIGL